MPQATYGFSVQAGGISIQGSAVRTGDGSIGKEVTLPVAWAVSSWVKTDADTAAGALATGHGQTTGTYDVYWSGGARYDVAVTVTGDSLALEGGNGTDFPASATSTVVICKQTTINVAIDGDALKLLALRSEYTDNTIASRARVLFEDAAGDDILSLPLTGNVAAIYDITGGATNSFTGDPITVARATHENTSATATLKICGVDDSTP